MLEAEIVQQEQLALLRCLIRHHGLRRVFSEGLSKEDLPFYRARNEALREAERQQKALLEQQDEVRQLLRQMAETGREGTDNHTQAVAIECEIANLLKKHRLELVELGAPGRLLLAGDIEEVLPLEDAGLLDQAKPVTPDGNVKLDPGRVSARQEAQVKAALEHGPFALIVLGGAHDLSAAVRKCSAETCEYIRVTTRSYHSFAEGE